MGHPKKTKKHYKKPRKTWDKQRIEEEAKLINFYGLKNKREIRIAEAYLRKKRTIARKLQALTAEERKKKEKELIESLAREGIVSENSNADDVLSLTVRDILERRLQTIVWRKNLARTIKQARQIIVHGHIAINGKRVNRPSYRVLKEEEGKIGYYGKKSKVFEEMMKKDDKQLSKDVLKTRKKDKEDKKKIQENIEEEMKELEELDESHKNNKNNQEEGAKDGE
ncbi:MAG: 30S ribosomal protein S4 [Candidatus Diapherotrites archaeon]|nr:30S ribosomal protein S4 [Candidatus Diapherotrites archaeon]